MGLMDKVKEQATQLAEKSKQGMAQGQAKLDTMQAKKRTDSLLHDLGAAYYAAERKGGPRDEVERLLADTRRARGRERPRRHHDQPDGGDRDVHDELDRRRGLPPRRGVAGASPSAACGAGGRRRPGKAKGKATATVATVPGV